MIFNGDNIKRLIKFKLGSDTRVYISPIINFEQKAKLIKIIIGFKKHPIVTKIVNSIIFHTETDVYSFYMDNKNMYFDDKIEIDSLTISRFFADDRLHKLNKCHTE